MPSLQVFEDAAREAPNDVVRRKAWADVLAAQGFRAAAAAELVSLQAEPLAFVDDAGTRWNVIASSADIAPAIDDARFPGALARSGARTLPLVMTLGPTCTHCDAEGTVECAECLGTGQAPSFMDHHTLEPCAPRRTCSKCFGSKFQVMSNRGSAGDCPHRGVVLEFTAATFELSRCRHCGLASLTCRPSWRDEFACGVCGRFACACTSR